MEMVARPLLSRALKVAMQRGYVARNIATLVDPPSASHDEIEPLTFDEALRVSRLAASRRNGTRWSIALALGLRQGEALGLRWQHVDLDAGTLTVRWQLQRLPWRHGCSAPHACGKDRHRDDCPPCCTRHARACPQRTGGGLRLTELKSEKSRRTIALPLQLVAALKTHRATQLHERMIAGSAWHDGDFVWCQPNGRPIGAHADWDEWNALLKAAAIRRVRVHDARHTAATLLLAQGVDQRVVMEILGHSQISMTSRYAHVLPHVMADAAQRIGQALWGETRDSTATQTATLVARSMR
jgi:integrase